MPSPGETGCGGRVTLGRKPIYMNIISKKAKLHCNSDSQYLHIQSSCFLLLLHPETSNIISWILGKRNNNDCAGKQEEHQRCRPFWRLSTWVFHMPVCVCLPLLGSFVSTAVTLSGLGPSTPWLRTHILGAYHPPSPPLLDSASHFA